MQKSEPVKLTLPNDLDFLPAVLAFARELAVICGFDEGEVNKIEVALEEAVTNIIRHSLSSDKTLFFDLEIMPFQSGMEFCLHDMGRPFDEKETEQYDPARVLQEHEVRGLGSFLIRKLMDVVEYQALGNKGKRLRMIKYFQNPPLNYDVTRSNQGYHPEESGQPSGDHTFLIRRFEPRDAEALAELAYDTYGYSYLYENVYFPDRMIAMNNTNEIISIVGVSGNGVLAGHAGLFCNPAYAGIAEMAMAMVKPEYRGYHLLDRISEKLYDTAIELGINGLFSQAITLHKRSQPSLKKSGLQPVGLLLGYFPAADFKGITCNPSDRVTPVVVFKLLRPYHAGMLYLPANQRDIIVHLLSSVSIGWENGKPFDTRKDQSVYSIQVNEVSSYARMFVFETGHDIILNLKQYLYRLRQEKLLIGELMLNLSDPLNAVFYQDIESLGFIFTGILPASTRGNFMTMVYLNGINANFDNIELIEDFGQDLLAYIRKDYERRFL
jgi:anti-sigma regulatory factor (Ser/Thr protein kinase)